MSAKLMFVALILLGSVTAAAAVVFATIDPRDIGGPATARPSVSAGLVP